MDIGAKIKRLRRRNQLTLEELAVRSELTKGFLSQVERDLTSPSITTLEDILEALGTTLGEFFADDKEEQIVFTAGDYFINTQEAYEMAFIVPNAQKNMMEPILLTLHPGCESAQYGPFEAEEFGYVLQGRVELVYGRQTLTVKKGQTFYFNADRLHYLKNPGNTDAKVLWITNPPSF